GVGGIPRVSGGPYAAELPARGRIKEVAVAYAGVARGRGVRAPSQHHLIDHELAVVFAERAGRRTVARIGRIGAAGPLPDDPEGIVDDGRARRDLPFGFGRQVLAGPSGQGVGLVVADMNDRRVRFDRLQSRRRELQPGAVGPAPVAGRLPSFGLDRGPAV